MRQFNKHILLAILFACLTIKAFTQKKKDLWQALNQVEQLFNKFEQISNEKIDNKATAYLETFKFLQLNKDALKDLNEQKDPITFCYFFRPKLGAELSLTKSALQSLVEAMEIQQAFSALIPDSSILHITDSSLKAQLNYTSLPLRQNADNAPTRSWKVPFDPWVNDVYQHNIKTNIQNAEIIPVLIEYKHFYNAYKGLRNEMPKRWKQKLEKMISN